MKNNNKIPDYITSEQYNMWTTAQPDKSKKGDKYQIAITLPEDILKKQMALEYKLGLNRHKMSQLPSIALNILYDIAFILDNDSILNMETEEILYRVADILNKKGR